LRADCTVLSPPSLGILYPPSNFLRGQRFPSMSALSFDAPLILRGPSLSFEVPPVLRCHFEGISPLISFRAISRGSAHCHFPVLSHILLNYISQKRKERGNMMDKKTFIMLKISQPPIPSPFAPYPFQARSPSRGSTVRSVGCRAISAGTCPRPSEWGP
jgi:hypothetical protein